MLGFELRIVTLRVEASEAGSRWTERSEVEGVFEAAMMGCCEADARTD